jgi:hypothetical protein
MIKLLKFDSSWIVSEVQELDAELGNPDCMLKYPYEIVNGELQKFPKFTDDREFMVRSLDIKLIAEPDIDTITLYYELKKQEKE